MEYTSAEPWRGDRADARKVDLTMPIEATSIGIPANPISTTKSPELKMKLS